MSNRLELTITRREGAIGKLPGWILVYGRRKVGKTFLLRRVLNWSHYFVITRAANVLVEERGGAISWMGLDAATKLIGELLKDGRVVVVDEFQRLPVEYWELISLSHPNGKLVASGSSFGIVQKVFEKRSPLLGLLSPFRMDIIGYGDTLLSLSEICPSLKDALLWSVVVRDPWVIPMFSIKNSAATELCNKAYFLAATVTGLIGEVFEEEGRSLTRIYDAVLRLVGEGLWKPAEVAGVLTSNGLVSGGVSTVTGLLDRLTNMGLLEKIVLWKTRGSRYYFKHRSPLLSIIHYLDQKLNIAEGVHNKPEMDLVLSRLGMEFQFCMGELMAEHLGGKRSYMMLPRGEGDIDIVILDSKGRAPLIGYEVKLGHFESGEARSAVEVIHSYGIPRAGLISASGKPKKVSGSYEELGPEELVSVARQVYKKNR